MRVSPKAPSEMPEETVYHSWDIRRSPAHLLMPHADLLGVSFQPQGGLSQIRAAVTMNLYLWQEEWGAKGPEHFIFYVSGCRHLVQEIFWSRHVKGLQTLDFNQTSVFSRPSCLLWFWSPEPNKSLSNKVCRNVFREQCGSLRDRVVPMGDWNLNLEFWAALTESCYLIRMAGINSSHLTLDISTLVSLPLRTSG